MVERLVRNEKVRGSNPLTSSALQRQCAKISGVRRPPLCTARFPAAWGCCGLRARRKDTAADFFCAQPSKNLSRGALRILATSARHRAVARKNFHPRWRCSAQTEMNFFSNNRATNGSAVRNDGASRQGFPTCAPQLFRAWDCTAPPNEIKRCCQTRSPAIYDHASVQA